MELYYKLLTFGFQWSSHDHYLFTKHSTDSFLALIVYVDDLLITSTHEHLLVQVKSFLDSAFSIKDLGHAHFFLGVEIACHSRGMYLSQRKYILNLIGDIGLTVARPTSTPRPPGSKLAVDDNPLFEDLERYLHLVGQLLYLNFTRPDITYGVQQLGQFVSASHRSHWDAAMHLLRYLKGTLSRGLFYLVASSLLLQVFSDADCASCTDTRRSLSSYYVFLDPALIAWRTKKQPTVSQSSVEAQYWSMATATCELQWCLYLLQDFSVLSSFMSLCGVIIGSPSTLSRIPSSINEPNFWTSIAIWFVRNLKLVCFDPALFLLLLIWSIFLPSPSPLLHLIVWFPSWAWLTFFLPLQLEGGMKDYHVQ